MKCPLVLILVFAFILCFAVAAQGSSISLGTLGGGSYWEDGTSMEDGIDASGLYLDADFMLGDTFKLGLGYRSGDTDDGYTDYRYLEADFGWRVLDGDFVLDLFAGYVRSDFYSDFTGENVVIGADMVYNFSDSFSIGATIKYPVWSDNNWGKDDFTASGYSLDLTYMFGDRLGLSLGYASTKHTAGGFNDFGLTGYTLGLVYSF